MFVCILGTLEKEFLSSNENVPTMSSSTIDKLLGSARTSIKKSPLTKPQPDHRPELTDILKKIPDLNYMQSNMLMFPVSSTS